MKLSPTLVRLAVLFPCVALFGVVNAQDAVPPVPAAPEAKPDKPAEKPIELPDTVATVNGKEISKAKLQEAFDNAVKMAGIDPSQLSNDEKLAGYNKLLDDMILDDLLTAQAEGIEVSDADVDKEVAQVKSNFPDEKTFEEKLTEMGQTPDKLRALIKNGLKQRKWIESQIGETKVTDEDAKKAYDEHIDQFKQPEMVKASHILFMVPDKAPEDVVKQKEEAAKAALEKAKATKTDEEFTALAKELSEEPGAKDSGGDLGMFPRGAMVKEFEDAAFAAKKGDIVGPVKTQFGYHIIKVTDKQDARTVPFDEAKEQIEGVLKQQKEQESVANLVDKVRSEAKIDVKIPKPAETEAPATGEAMAPAEDSGQ